MLPLLLTLLTATPAVELAPIVDPHAVDLVVHAGKWSAQTYDGVVRGQFLVWRDGKWRGVAWGGCGNGFGDAVVEPGTVPTSTGRGMREERLAPGRYRYVVRLTSTSSKEQLVVARAFSILPVSDGALAPLRDAMIERLVRRCGPDRATFALLGDRASTSQLRAMFEDPRMTLQARRALVRLVDDPDLVAAFPAMVRSGSPDVALAAAVLIHDREGGYDDVIVAGVERGEDVAESLRFGRHLLATELAERLVVVLERTTDTGRAIRLSSVLSARQLTSAQNARGAARLDALANAEIDPTVQAQLRIAAAAWRDGHTVDGDVGCCAEPMPVCPPPTAVQAAVQALRAKTSVVDEGPVALDP